MIKEIKKKVERTVTVRKRVCDVCGKPIEHKVGDRVVFATEKEAGTGLQDRKQWHSYRNRNKRYHFHNKCFLSLLNK